MALKIEGFAGNTVQLGQSTSFKQWLKNPLFIEGDESGLKAWHTMQLALAQQHNAKETTQLPLHQIVHHPVFIQLKQELSQSGKRDLRRLKNAWQMLAKNSETTTTSPDIPALFQRQEKKSTPSKHSGVAVHGHREYLKLQQQQLRERLLNDEHVEPMPAPQFNPLWNELRLAHQRFVSATGDAITVTRPVATFRLPAASQRLWNTLIAHVDRQPKPFKQKKQTQAPPRKKSYAFSPQNIWQGLHTAAQKLSQTAAAWLF